MVEKRPMTEIGSGPVTLGPANRKEPKMGEPTITPALREQVKVEAVKLVDEAIARREAKQTLAVASTPAMCGQLKENAMRAVAKGLKEEGAVSTVIAGSQLAHELGKGQSLGRPRRGQTAGDSSVAPTTWRRGRHRRLGSWPKWAPLSLRNTPPASGWISARACHTDLEARSRLPFSSFPKVVTGSPVFV